MSNPLVSIVTPCTRPDLVKRAIASILQQTYPYFELLVINDGGQDITKDLEVFQDSRIRYFFHQECRGRSAARNTALKQAQGKYIAYLDDDDYYYPYHLQTLVDFLQTSNYKAAYADGYQSQEIDINGDFEVSQKHLVYSNSFSFDKLLVDSIFDTNGVMHERDCLEKSGIFDENLAVNEDWDLWIRIALHHPFHHIDQITHEYTNRLHSNQSRMNWMGEVLSTALLIYHRYRNYAAPIVQQQQMERLQFLAKYALTQLSCYSPSRLQASQPNLSTLALNIVERSHILGESEILEKGKQIAQKLVHLFPEDPNAWLALVKSLRLSGQYTQALETLNQALAIHQTNFLLSEQIHTLKASNYHQEARQKLKHFSATYSPKLLSPKLPQIVSPKNTEFTAISLFNQSDQSDKISQNFTNELESQKFNLESYLPATLKASTGKVVWQRDQQLYAVADWFEQLRYVYRAIIIDFFGIVAFPYEISQDQEMNWIKQDSSSNIFLNPCAIQLIKQLCSLDIQVIFIIKYNFSTQYINQVIDQAMGEVTSKTSNQEFPVAQDPKLQTSFTIYKQSESHQTLAMTLEKIVRDLMIPYDQLVYLGHQYKNDFVEVAKHQIKSFGYQLCEFQINHFFEHERTLVEKDDILSNSSSLWMHLSIVRSLAVRLDSHAQQAQKLYQYGALIFGPLITQFATWCIDLLHTQKIHNLCLLKPPHNLLSQALRNAGQAKNLQLNIIHYSSSSQHILNQAYQSGVFPIVWVDWGDTPASHLELRNALDICCPAQHHPNQRHTEVYTLFELNSQSLDLSKKITYKCFLDAIKINPKSSSIFEKFQRYTSNILQLTETQDTQSSPVTSASFKHWHQMQIQEGILTFQNLWHLSHQQIDRDSIALRQQAFHILNHAAQGSLQQKSKYFCDLQANLSETIQLNSIDNQVPIQFPQSILSNPTTTTMAQQPFVTFITDDPGVGGVDQYNQSILTALYQQNYHVSLIKTSQVEPIISFEKNPLLANLETYWMREASEFKEFLLQQRRMPDLIIFSNCTPFSNFAFKQIALELKLSYIYIEGLVEPYLTQINISYLSTLVQYYQYAKAVIAVSHDNLQSLYQYFGLFPHQGQVIYYGRPLDYFTPNDTNKRNCIRQDLNIPLNATLCLTTARLEERKGYQYQIEAIRHLIHTPAWGNLYFLWVGGSIFAPQFEAWIRHEINTLGIQDRIIILDRRSDIADLLNAADIFVLPSRAEGMPLSIMEAMAKGLPVIATAISGIPEELGDSAYLLPDPNLNPQATIQRLIEILQDWTLNPHKTAQIAEEGHRRAQHHFQEQRMTDQTLAVIEQALLQPQDYISSNLQGIDLAAAFPHRVQGDPSTCQWPYLRREIPHPWYVDQRQPIIGFLSPDEAHILYNNALQFKGRSALEIGCWLGWSACHLAAAGVKLDVVDPLLQQPGIYQSVASSLALAGVTDTVNLVPGSSPEAIEVLGTEGKRQWSLIFIDGNHEDDGPLQDAIVCEKFAATDALIMFHDLAAPAVAKGLDYYRQKGWKTLVYQTMQIMGVAWRGNVQPVLHQADPRVHWVLPPHLQRYPVSHLGLDLTQYSITSLPPLTKVTFCTCDSPNFSGGPNSFLRELLPALQAKGITVEILIFVAAIPQACPCFAALDRAGIACKTFPWQTTTEQKIRWILSQLTESPPDIFVPNMLVSAFYASRWVKASGIPTVGILHSDDDFHHQVLQDFVLGDPSYRFSAIVPVSQKLHSMVQEALQSQPSSSSYSLDPVVTACIPYGASLPNETAQVPQETLRLIYTGRLEIEQKQILKLTQALCQVVNIVPGVEALIVGEGSARAEIQEILQKDPNLPVHLVGFVDQEHVKNYLLQSHVFVLLSDYEGLPVSLIEAMACGLVPVCLDIRSGIPELVEDGVTGLLVHDREESFVQAIQTLKTDMELWSTLSRSARAKIESNYSSQVSTDQWLQLLQDLHQRHPRQNPPPPPLKVPTLIDLPPVRPVFLREDFRQDILLTPPNQKTDQSANQLEGLPAKVIVIDAVFFQLFQTGIARVWRSILTEWANTEFGRHIVILDRAQTAPQIPGLRYRTIPAFSYQNLEGDRQLLQQICDEENADLLISTYYTTPLTTPTVFMGYDMIPEVMQSLGVPVDLKDPMWAAKHHAINHASHYITISENTAQDLRQFFPEIEPEQVTVAPCGVSPNFTPPTAAEITQFKHKYGITKPYFMTIGSGAGGYKNLILFYQAIAQLPTRHGFDIVATGVYLQVDPQFRDLAQGITIHTLNLSDEELRLAYGGAISLVYPSSYEGFGMPIAEAMACGCPVITCPNASIPEVAGEAALYVFDQDIDGMAEALCEVQKPTVRNSLIPAGLEQVRQFSWTTMAETVAQTLITVTLANLNLCDHNLIAFPDWTQDEDDLQASLTEALRQVVHYAASLETDLETLQLTLLIDIHLAPELDLDALMASAAMELMMSEELEIPDGVEVVPLPNLSPLQWQQLRLRLVARVALEVENGDRIETVCPDLPILTAPEA